MPFLPELAHYLDMSIDKVHKYSDSSRTVLSLELPVDVQNYKGLRHKNSSWRPSELPQTHLRQKKMPKQSHLDKTLMQ